jgi:hypothetical protein
MARRSLPRKVTYFEPVPPRLARNTIIESTFEGRPPLSLHDARRLRRARSRCRDPARRRRVAAAHARPSPWLCDMLLPLGGLNRRFHALHLAGRYNGGRCHIKPEKSEGHGMSELDRNRTAA